MPSHDAGTEQGGAALACMVAELTKPMMRAAMYCEAPTCSTPFSVDLGCKFSINHLLYFLLSWQHNMKTQPYS